MRIGRLFGLFLAMSGSVSAYSQDSCRTGYTSPAVTGNVSFGNPINWSSPNRAMGSDNLSAESNLSSGDTGKYLRVNDFAFAIPSGATIIGIRAAIERKMDASADIKDASVKLLVNDVISGTEHSGSSTWTTADVITEYGDFGDNWGLSLTPADINASNFGVLLSVTRLSGTGSKKAYVDDVALEIFFTLPDGSGCSPYFLPVTLISFNAEQDASKGIVNLNWTTSSEVNNHYFSIERSSNGIFFEKIAEVYGQGTTSARHSYSFTDHDPLWGTSYYRLRQTDFDGANKAVGKIIPVQLKSFLNSLSVFPNPSTGFISIDKLSEGGNAVLINEQGRKLKNFFLFPGQSNIDLTDQVPGVYFLEVSSAGDKVLRKVVLR